MRTPLLATAVMLLGTAGPAMAQWSSDPAVNLRIASGAGEQVQAKLAPTGDGGTYVSWFDNGSGGYDVRLQRLDAAGNAMLGANGVLVADRGFSSTQDYALDVDAAGNALLAFRDDRFGGTQITATVIAPNGASLWGPNGVQLTNTTGFVAAPKIAGTSDGQAVVAWTEDSDTRVQRLDGFGNAVWLGDVVLTPAAGRYSASDLQDSGADAILGIVHQTGSSFSSPKHIVAQKFDATGAALWGPAPVAVFDGGSLQIGNFPTLQSDGSGGALFAWYGVSPLQCYAQRILANGSEAFPHNGAPGSTNAAQIRVSPSVAFDAVSNSTFLFWEEQNGGQSQSGLSGQRFDATGAPQWGANGTTLLGLSSTKITGVQTLWNGAETFVFWSSSAGFGQDVIRGASVDAAGAFALGPFDVGSTPSNKLRLTARTSSAGESLVAWEDEDLDAGDILGQNVRADGSLGGSLGTLDCFGLGCPCGNDDGGAGCANSTGAGAQIAATGTASAAADNLGLTGAGLPAGKPSLLFSGPTAIAPSLFGDGLRCVGGQLVRHGVVVSDAGGGGAWGPGLAATNGWTAGTLRRFQVWYRDNAGPCGNGFNTSPALELTYLP